jgi:hypothetical protein
MRGEIRKRSELECRGRGSVIRDQGSGVSDQGLESRERAGLWLLADSCPPFPIPCSLLYCRPSQMMVTSKLASSNLYV